MIKTSTLRDFHASCCAQTFTDRTDWAAHQKTSHRKVAPTTSKAPKIAIRKPSGCTPLNDDEQQWLGEEVTWLVNVDGADQLRMAHGNVWSLAPGRGMVWVAVTDEYTGAVTFSAVAVERLHKSAASYSAQLHSTQRELVTAA